MKKEKRIKIKDLPKQQRPYEKCILYGEHALTDAELIAAIIRTGTVDEQSVDVAERVLCCNNKAGLFNLHLMTIDELKKIKGIGNVKAVQLKCIAELVKRLMRSTKVHGNSFTSPEIVADYYMEEMRNLDTECLKAIFLDGKSRFIKDVTISKGTVNSAVASSREIFVSALRNGAVNIILIHNHPSGDPEPSLEDICVSLKIKEAGEIVGINLIDHIIIGDNCYYSLKEAGHI